MRRAPFSLVPGTRSRVRAVPALTAAAATLALLPGAASATPLTADGAASSARIATAKARTTTLPSQVATAARRSAGDTGRWLIAASGDRTRLAQLAARNGGSFNATLGILSVPTATADRIADQLGSAVLWAEADAPAVRSSSFDRPANVQSPWSRPVGLAPSLTPAPGTLATIGIVDDAVDRSVAELAAADVINGVGAVEPHGTMVASTAAAPYDGTGVVGVAPGAPVLSWGTTLLCSDVASGVINLVKRGAQVINLSLGFTENCGALLAAVAYTYAKGVTLVVASGNDGDNGNPLSFPASYPHVITAGAIDESLSVASFSNFNEYVDVAAPGVGVPVDVPLRWDVEDGSADGLTTVDGTSFASPFVAGGVSWILGARPNLDPSQVAAVLRASARDLGAPGWDERSGYGLLQIAPALAAPTPQADLLEPNDYPSFTAAKGTFRKRTIWSGGRAATITATGDSADDYVDAYRIKVPARSSAKITLKPTAGLANLFSFDQSVRSFSGKPIDSSTRGGLKTDTISLRNSGSKSRIAFVVVNTVPSGGTRTLSSYALTVKRG
ncbi:MAG: S8 family serine peptidase [Solirubrobacteraceae bacterium]|nr:S8 family serine peptidase [Solirubrobacteraceae bacterium]